MLTKGPTDRLTAHRTTMPCKGGRENRKPCRRSRLWGLSLMTSGDFGPHPSPCQYKSTQPPFLWSKVCQPPPALVRTSYVNAPLYDTRARPDVGKEEKQRKTPRLSCWVGIRWFSCILEAERACMAVGESRVLLLVVAHFHPHV